MPGQPFHHVISAYVTWKSHGSETELLDFEDRGKHELFALLEVQLFCPTSRRRKFH